MSKVIRRASIVSGYFDPLHPGHLDLFHAARQRNNYLIVVVNSDPQQILKKGRVIVRAQDRVRLMKELRVVDDTILCIDQGAGVDKTFDHIRQQYPLARLEFCNGGDQSDVHLLPSEERLALLRNDIHPTFGVGGTCKVDSSTRILSELAAVKSPKT